MIKLINRAILTTTLALAAGSDASRADEPANAIRARTDASGRVQGDLAEKTGWTTARGFLWRIVLIDGPGATRIGDPSRPFTTGQAFALEIEADTDLWVYVLNRGTDGTEVALFPEQDEEHLLVKKGRRVRIPGTGQFRFTDPPGTEHFRIVASPNRLPWVRPRELFALDQGQELPPAATATAERQRALRTARIKSFESAQPRPLSLRTPLSRELTSRRPPWSGRKDTVLVAPADEPPASPPPPRPDATTSPASPPESEFEGAQQVTLVSTDPVDRQAPIVFEIPLTHNHPPPAP